MIRELICYRCICSKCDHTWITKGHDLPKVCSACKRLTWNDDFDFRTLADPVESPPISSRPTYGRNLDAAIPQDATKDEKLAALRELIGQRSEPVPVVEEWVFTKDKPQFADDGNVYRRQVLAPAGKRFRTVRVSENDYDELYA